MKNMKILLGALTLGVTAFVAGKASAFPLALVSASGTISYTPSYSQIQGTNVARISKVSVTMKSIMTVVSNEVFLRSQTMAPKDAVIAYDPYQDVTFLTNKSGFHYGLSGIVTVDLQDIATSFHGNPHGGSESDTIVISLRVYGRGPDGTYFEFYVNGQGTLQFSVDKNNKGSMSLSLSGGADYGEYKNSDDGVSKGGFTFKGTGTPEWSEAFSTYWY